MSDDPETDELQALRIDSALLVNDDSRPGWQRRAVGVSRAQALGSVPRVGMLQCQVPIEALREIQRHITRSAANQAVWVREAVVARYLREGGNAEVGAAALDMRVDRRQRDVPRDQYGQDRRRVGRKGRGS